MSTQWNRYNSNVESKGNNHATARISNEEIDRCGQELYERQIRDQVETSENIGKQIVIDIETGAYEVDDDGLKASRRLLAKHSDSALYGLRIGYDSVYSIGGVLTPTTRP